MKKIFYIIMLLSFSRLVLGQTNLIPNPSFEDTVNCPFSFAEPYNSLNWNSYNGSPDYFNACSSYSNAASTPYNCAGYQVPKTGLAYMGVLTYVTQLMIPNGREFVGAKLTTTLSIGQKYFVSLKCVATKSSLGPSNCYSDKLGFNFSKYSYYGANPYPITNSAKVFATTILNDTVNWMTIKGSFVADSAYEYVIVGNFFDDNSTDTLIFDSDPNCLGAYYFIDDLCLSTDSNFAYNYIPTKITESNKYHNIKIYPNPASNYIYVKPSGNAKISKFDILDKCGQIILTKTNLTFDKIDLSNIPDGLYFIQIISDDKTYYDKIIVRH